MTLCMRGRRGASEIQQNIRCVMIVKGFCSCLLHLRPEDIVKNVIPLSGLSMSDSLVLLRRGSVLDA